MSEQTERSASKLSLGMQKTMEAPLEEARQRVKHLVMQARQSERISAEFLEVRLKTADIA